MPKIKRDDFAGHILALAKELEDLAGVVATGGPLAISDEGMATIAEMFWEIGLRPSAIPGAEHDMETMRRLMSHIEDARRNTLLTVEEVALDLKLHQETIRRWIKSGNLPAVRIGREYRIPL